MLLKEILKDDGFREAEVVAASQFTNNEVTTVRIFDAFDIEEDASENQLILTDNHTLMMLEEKELLSLFEQLQNVKTSGIILKMDDLVKVVPPSLTKKCEDFNIPLVIIPDNTKYETIIQVVLQAIIDEKSRMLNSYYNARKTITHHSLNDRSFTHLLTSFKELLNVECQFNNESGSVFLTTDKKQPPYTVISIKKLPKIKFVDNQYYEKLVKFQDGHQAVLVTVDIPDILDQKYSFSIFNSFNLMSEGDIMLVEKAVELFLMELLKLSAIKKNQSMRKNNQMHDLLLSRYYTVEERDVALNQLNIDTYSMYQGMIISLYGIEDTLDDNLIRSPLDPAIDYIKSRYKHIAYFKKNCDVVFLYNFKEEEHAVHKESLQPIIDHYHRMNSNLTCHIGISSIQQATLESINDNLLSLKKFMKMVHTDSSIIEYDQMGFFKLFYNIESLDELLDYVPNNVITFIKEKVEFAKTLAAFLSLSQNYVKTGERLFVHPKTVRYRIEQSVSHLGLDLDDENTLLSLQVAF